MTTTPTLPPQPWFDPKTGNATEPFRRHYEALWRQAGSTDNTITSNVNSGVAQAQAEAAAAQAAADAAAQGVADLAGDALAFSAAASPSSLYKTRLGSGGIVSNSTTVTPTGGTGPYTYSWAIVSGDSISITSPTSQSTTFSTTLSAGEDTQTVIRCTVTDSLAAEATCTVSNTFVELS